MDGSVSTSQIERIRFQSSHGLANRAATGASAQSELFEQLLSLNFSVEPPPDLQELPQESASIVEKDTLDSDEDAEPIKAEEETEQRDDDANVVSLVPDASLVNDLANLPKADDSADVELTKPDKTEKLCDLPVANVDAVKPVAIDAAVEAESNMSVDETATVETNATAQPTDDAATGIETMVAGESREARRPRKDIDSNEKTVEQHVTAVDPARRPGEKVENNSTEGKPHSELAGTAQNVQAQQPKSELGEGRRGDRREKWFERDTQSAMASDEKTTDALSTQLNLTDELSEAGLGIELDPAAQTTPVLEDVTQVIENTATQTPTSSALSAMQPTAASVSATTIAQFSASSSSEVSTTSSSASHNLGPSAPTRTVGTQTAKADSKHEANQPEVSQQERVRVIQRIARSFNRLSAEGGTINLRLHPEHLGSVTVQVRMEGRSLAAKLSTETTAARDAIMADLPALRQRLADQGFDVTKFQVDVTENGADTTFAQTDGQQANGQSQSGQYGDRSAASQPDYRRIAAIRSSQLALATPVTITATTLAASGIDLQA